MNKIFSNPFIGTLCVFVCLPSIANGQVPEATLGTGLSTMLNIQGVVNELEMTPEQQNDLQDYSFEVRQKIAGKSQVFRRLLNRKLSDERKTLLTGEWLMAIQEIRSAEEASLAKVLDSAQLKRLKQIRFQYLTRRTNGVDIIAESLNFSESQIRKLEELKSSYRKKLFKQNEEKDFESVKQLKESEKRLFDDFIEEFEQVMTKNQRRKLKDFQGEAFDFSTKKKGQTKKIS